MARRRYTPKLKAKVALVRGAREAHGLAAALWAAGLARSTWYYYTRTRVTYAEKYAHLEAPLKAIAEALCAVTPPSETGHHSGPCATT